MKKIKILEKFSGKEIKKKLGIAKQPITAHEAYMQANYSKVMTDEELLQRFYKNTNKDICTKSNSGNVSMFVTIDRDVLHHRDEIVEYYRNQGYQVVILAHDSHIPGLKLSVNSPTYMVLLWGEYTPDQETVNPYTPKGEMVLCC